VKIWICAI